MKHRKACEKGRSLASLVDCIGKYTETSGKLTRGVTAVEGVVALGQKWKKLRTRVRALRELVEDYEELKELSQKEIPDVTPLIALRDTKERMGKETRELRSALATWDMARQKLKDVSTNADEAQACFDEEMGDQCALCGSQL